MKTISLTEYELSEIMEAYHQGRNDMSRNTHCTQYESWLESQLGHSFFYLENMDLDLYEYEYEPLFYIHLTQEQEELNLWMDALKEDITIQINYILSQLTNEQPELNEIELFYEFCDDQNIDPNELTPSCFIHQAIENFPREI